MIFGAAPRRRRLIGAVVGLACLAAGMTLALALAPYPELAAFRTRGYSTRVLDRVGELLAILPAPGGVRREYAALSDLPREAVQVFTGSEDRRFFLHPGVDPAAIARSLFLDFSAGRTVSGASTITMQLARLVKPGRGGLRGKLADAFDALRIEAKMPKKAILELYLNSVPFGSMTEGLASASRLYFGKSVGLLTPAELCILAVIPRRPSRYDPRSDPGTSGAAAAKLAGSLGLPASLVPDLSPAHFVALARGTAERSRNARDFSYPESVAPHFIRQWFASGLPGSRDGAQARAQSELRTSIDPDIQRRLVSALAKKIAENRQYRMTNGAGLVVDNRTGEILAWVGSVDFSDGAAKGQIDGVRAPNQPGSCLKPFLYALAMEDGFTPATILPDLPADFGSEEAYVPVNFNNRFNGLLRLRVALASSLNVPAVHTLERVGVPRFVRYLRRLGFSTMEGMEDEAGVGLALGNAPVSLFELVRAFSAFPRGGLSISLRATAAPAMTPSPAPLSVPTPGAAPLGTAFPGGAVRVMSPYAAGIIRDILSDQPSRFAGFAHGRLLSREYDAMFKTGTANQFQHVWALGATPDYTAGIWMGNFTGETLIGARSSGVPAAVLVEVLDAIAKPDSRFPPVPDASKVEICASSGLAATPACPGTLVEYMPRGIPLPGPCDLHSAPGRTVAAGDPSAFGPVAGNPGSPSGSTPAAASPGLVPTALRFVHPRDGALFYIDPSLPQADQAIGIRLEGLSSIPAGKTAWLYVDGAARAPVSEGGRIVLPLVRGNFRLSIRVSGREMAYARMRVR